MYAPSSGDPQGRIGVVRDPEIETAAMKKQTVPYASATTDKAARAEIMKILRQFGCEKIGFMDHDDEHAVELFFRHRGQQVRLKAPAKGWAQLWLNANPWNSRMRRDQHEYAQGALRQGLISVNSMIREWVKSQMTLVECGILSFETVFLPHMLTSDGRTVAERLPETGLLPSPDPLKVVSIQGPR
jgi:hypothetical protein